MYYRTGITDVSFTRNTQFSEYIHSSLANTLTMSKSDYHKLQVILTENRTRVYKETTTGSRQNLVLVLASFETFSVTNRTRTQ